MREKKAGGAAITGKKVGTKMGEALKTLKADRQGKESYRSGVSHKGSNCKGEVLRKINKEEKQVKRREGRCHCLRSSALK